MGVAGPTADEAAGEVRQRRFPAAVWCLTGALAAVAVGAGRLASGVESVAGRSLPPAAVVILVIALTWAACLQLRFSHRASAEDLDLFDAVLAPVMFTLSGPAVVLMAAVAMAASELIQRTRPVKASFNVAQWAAAAGAGSLTYALLSDGHTLSARNLAALALAMGVVAVVNHLAVVAVLVLVTPEPVTHVLSSVAPVVRPGWLLGGALNLAFGFLLVAALATGPWTTVLFVVPLGMLHWANRGYAEAWADRARLAGLQRATHALGAPIDPRDGIADFLAEVRSCFNVEVAELVLSDGHGYRVQRLASAQAADVESWTCGDDADTLALSLLRGGVAERIGAHHPDETRRDLLGAEGWRDCLAAPLPSKGEVRGILCAYDRTGLEGFETGEVTVLEALARELAGALEKADLVEEVLHQALHDSLTGLPNRTLFSQRVQRAVGVAEAVGGQVAVLLIDVNRFKEVNDTLGHDNGDLLLQDFSRRLEDSLRPGDTVARLGGDEFGILVPRVDGRAGAERVAHRVLRAIDEPFALHDLTLDVDAAIGIALYPDHGADAATLLQRADVAMYGAKASHAGFEVYATANDRYSPRRLALVGELRSAASHGELRVQYQPKCDLHTGRVIGVEALLRWEHPKHGRVSPDEFIPIAEQTGSIRALTAFVLEEALSQCAAWRAAGLELGMAVNLSARSLLDTELPDEIARLLRSTTVPPHLLTLELTESTMMAEPERTAVVLERLHNLGVQLSIDDFGTGYSSLSYLKRLPVDEMKIDKSFVCTMGTDDSDDVIVRSTVDLGHNLGLRVVAEGVEDQRTWERLAALGCDYAQGFWMSRPVTADEIVPLVARLQAARALSTAG